MHILALVLLAAAAPTSAAAAPTSAAAAQADQSPRELLSSLGIAPSDEVVKKAVRAAADHPLGTRKNPVRTSGPAGEHAYIARLRCADGAAPKVGTRSNGGLGVFGTIIDVYPLDCGVAAPGKVDLIMDMYHDGHDEAGAPEGFTIVPR